MQAAVLKGKHQIELMEWKVGRPAADEVKIAVKSCGICGTDQHIYHGHPGSAEVAPPLVLGHELAGEIVEVGTEVTGLRIGDRVTVDPNIYCGLCGYCRKGIPHLCERLQAVGVTRDGGMGEYALAPAANCYSLPQEMSYEEGALVEPLGCVLHGFQQVKLSADHNVLIIGGGFIGQLFLQLARKQGAGQITVSEPSDEKRDILAQFGADRIVNPTTDPDALQLLKNQADVVIECVGRQETMELAIEAARKGGQVLLFGVASPSTRISLSPFDVFSKELKITGSFINPFTHEEAISLIKRGIVQVEPLISHRFPLSEIPDAMKNYADLKVTKGIIVY